MSSDKAFSPLLAKLRAERPLVHNITNFVVMNFTANVLLAAGASPVMAHAPEEVAEFAAMSGALVVNMGTIDSGFFGAMDTAVRKARKRRVPWVFDPVGIGATSYREGIGKHLAKQGPSVIRGNAGEDHGARRTRRRKQGRRLDRRQRRRRGRRIRLSLKRKTVVAVTVATDYVAMARTSLRSRAGTAEPARHRHRMRDDGAGRRVPRRGAAEGAAVAALRLMKHAAEEAGARRRRPRQFAVSLLDALAGA